MLELYQTLKLNLNFGMRVIIVADEIFLIFSLTKIFFGVYQK